MKTDLDTVISEVEVILRLRGAVRVAKETIVRTTNELVIHREHLTKCETALAATIGATVTDAFETATLKVPGGWTAAPVERAKLGRAKKGDVVWMTRRKELGVVTKVDRYGDHTVSAFDKDYHYTVRNLRAPLPGEAEDWQERRELLAETPNA